MADKLDLIIVGAGPSGLACAIEACRRKLDFLLVEKGCVVNSIYHFPENMTFFTTGELLEIGDIPMVVRSEKPKRSDALQYYRRVVDHFQIPLRDGQKVVAMTGADGNFQVVTKNSFQRQRSYDCRKIIVATGYFDQPNRLEIPGEDLPKVSHYYTDPHPYFRKEVAVVGGKNSAAIAALELYRADAEVLLIHRGTAMSSGVKYWILPDINNRLKNGEIEALFSSQVTEIRESEITVSTPQGEKVFENDFVFAMTGYHPDGKLLREMGVEVHPETLVPSHDPDTLESNVTGVYLAGSVVSGKFTSRIFIETGRFHGEKILPHLVASLQAPKV